MNLPANYRIALPAAQAVRAAGRILKCSPSSPARLATRSRIKPPKPSNVRISGGGGRPRQHNMATTNVSQYVTLAKTLPPKLQRFFARYPPTQILNPLPDGEYARTGYQEERRNPFAPKKFHPTGKTHNPVYSLRRQADLVKLARENGVEELLPFTPKKTEEQLKHRVTYGLRVKGTGVDQKVKGKIHERQLATKMEKRREAMLKMPALIREWKAVGRKNWTKWPK